MTCPLEELVGFPTEILVEIFSHVVARYSEFRCLSRTIQKTKIPWDEWDALIDQGWTVTIEENAIFWKKNLLVHSPPFPRPFGQEVPAMEVLYEASYWYKKGHFHREGDLPAIKYTGGQMEWWIDGEVCRDNDLPAVIDDDGDMFWYKNGHRGRDNGLPAIVRVSRIKIWWCQNGNPCRIEYPDRESRSSKNF